MHDVKGILTNLGYTLSDSGQFYRTKPLYRDSSSNTVLSVRKDTGRWIDFKEQKFGSLEELIQITLNLQDLNEAKSYLSDNFQFTVPKTEKEKVEANIKKGYDVNNPAEMPRATTKKTYDWGSQNGGDGMANKKKNNRTMF